MTAVGLMLLLLPLLRRSGRRAVYRTFCTRSRPRGRGLSFIPQSSHRPQLESRFGQTQQRPPPRGALDARTSMISVASSMRSCDTGGGSGGATDGGNRGGESGGGGGEGVGGSGPGDKGGGSGKGDGNKGPGGGDGGRNSQ